jgi:hypothetical protein
MLFTFGKRIPLSGVTVDVDVVVLSGVTVDVDVVVLRSHLQARLSILLALTILDHIS